MEERRKNYSVLEQLVVELAQLLGKKVVDQEGGEDEVATGSNDTVVEGTGNGVTDASGSTESVADVVTEKAPGASAELKIEEGDSFETENLNKAQLVAVALKSGIPIDQRWSEDKLRQVIEEQLNPAAPVKEEKPVAKKEVAKEAAAKPSAKVAAKPKVGDKVLVNEDGNWVAYDVTAVRGTSVYTKKWQLNVADEGTDWKMPE